MDVIRIVGGNPLAGTVRVGGAKNAALPVFAAALLTSEPVELLDVPELSDVVFMARLLEHLGARVEHPEPRRWRIHAAELSGHTAPYDLVRKMRASVCLMGPLLGRMKRAVISQPGGCVIGPRPIDLHVKGFARMGCIVRQEGGYMHLDGSAMRGAEVFLGGRNGSTVTGTANVLMAAVLTPGTTRIDSAACEPEIVDLCRLLTAMGARIDGIGSPALTVEGVDRLRGCTHTLVPDRIEAGTFLIAAAMTGGRVTVDGARAEDLGALLDKLREARVHVAVDGPARITVRAGRGQLAPVDVVTLPHPGFPTDLQAQMCALMSVTPGISIVTERIYPGRFMHVPEMQRMGADVSIEGPSAIVKGRPALSGAPVMASDLRASAALVLCGLVAEGETWVQRVYHLDRGYERMELKLRDLGADIERLPAERMPRGYAPDEA